MKLLGNIFVVVCLLTMFSCSALKYVPEGDYLLRKNELELVTPKRAVTKVDSVKDSTNVRKSASKNETFKLSKDVIEGYIQQRPNRRLLGIGLPLAFYNSTDTSKHSWWHKFWRNTVGQPPVIYDSNLTTKSDREIDLYMISNGYFNSTVSDSLMVSKRRKATVKYTVDAGEPYFIKDLKYEIEDDFLRRVIMTDTVNSLIKSGEQFRNTTLEQERLRVANFLRNEGFWGFGINYINYIADSTVGNHMVDLTLKVRRLSERVGLDGVEEVKNHPIYRLNRIVVNTYYDPTMTIETANQVEYDSMEYNGITVLYDKKLLIRPKILVDAIRLSPNELFSQTSVTRTSENLRRLSYSANILFSPVAENTSNPIVVTLSDPNQSDVSTTERMLNCDIQCTPSKRHSFSTEFEASTTTDYYSLALSLGYENRNVFRGAENFNISFRGAYEFMKAEDQSNAYEFGVSASLRAPRFWLPISMDKASLYKNAESKISLSYSIQKRPFYRRTLVSGVFGYGWTFKNGGRFTINPADINVVDVPWVDPDFLEKIENPYLRNSYQSQLIAGASTSYYYNTNSKMGSDGFTFKVNADMNGNLFYGLTSLFGKPMYSEDGQRYYNLFGLQFAQYVRATVDVSGRSNLSARSQLAWRVLIAGGYAYGNSRSVPFERLFFAGGSNSMRGWQVRTLGPGSVLYNSSGAYPNQLGDMRLEANLEYRLHLIFGLSMAVFLDAGNIWMNAGEPRPEARFNFSQFYKQIAFNTGLGIRYNVADLMILRLDWGLKLHNPNMPVGMRWFKNLAFNDTAFHFALGLPF